MTFQEGRGDVRNYARPTGIKGYDWKSVRGHLKGDCEWTVGRWPKKKKAVLIPGWYSYIEIPHNDAFKFGTFDNYTICLWLCLDFPESAGPILTKGYIADTKPGYFSEIYLGNVGKWEDDEVPANFDVICSGRKSNFLENTVMCYPKVFKKHEWVHVVLRNRFVKNLKFIDLFINGEKMTVENEEEYADTIAMAAPLLIGAVTPQKTESLKSKKPDPDEKKYGFKGRIDELLIFRRALKDKEVIKQYEAGCLDPE
ncbi:MAG: LamG domain-containing protein [Lentisphaerae bacterium]|nr:LamG domain-containing protein [Lentisphaerota bacterium]MCP4101254.1 LamG domain-containing protein [Lentisphaerota bacterium]